MRLLVIIVNYASAEDTIACLHSVGPHFAQTDDDHLVVIDAASPDDSYQQLQASIRRDGFGSWCTLIAGDRNGGFAYSNNAAIRYAVESFGEPEFVLLLNPDTIVLDDAIEQLVRFSRSQPRIGIVGPGLQYADGERQCSAFRFHTPVSQFLENARTGLFDRWLTRYVVAQNIPETAQKTDWVSGACFLVRYAVMRDIGLLDDRFFLYFEETDYCLRAAAADWECWYLPSSRVIHHVSRTTGITADESLSRLPSYWFQSRLWYYTKHFGTRGRRLANLAWLAGHFFWRLRRLLTWQPTNLRSHLLRDFLKNLWSTPVWRD